MTDTGEHTPLLKLIKRLEEATKGSKELNAAIWQAVDQKASRIAYNDARAFTNRDWSDEEKDKKARDKMARYAPDYTTSLDAARSLGGMLVFASDIGADGLPLVKLVFDTSTAPVIEYCGIGRTLELSWCIAALRALLKDRGE